MAEEAPSLELKALLVCPICLDQYDNPKTLPCLHSFCLKCVEQVVGQDRIAPTITCPVCMMAASLPENGVSGFPTSFFINNLIELSKKLGKGSLGKDEGLRCGNCGGDSAISSYCEDCVMAFCGECLVHHNKLKNNAKHRVIDIVSSSIHHREVKCVEHGKPLSTFCMDCQVLACDSCVSGSHLGHRCGPVTDVFPKQYRDIVSSLRTVRRNMSAIEDVRKAFTMRKKMLSDRGESVKADVRFNTKLVVQKFLKYEEELIQYIDHIVENKLNCLTQREEQVEKSLTEMRNCAEYIEQSVQAEGMVEILSEKQRMMQLLQAVCDQDLPRPEEEPSFKFVPSESTGSLGVIDCTYTSCKIDSTNHIFPMIGKEFAVILALSTTVGDPINTSIDAFKLELVSTTSKNLVECSVKKVKGEVGQYAVCFTVRERGEHNLIVEVMGSRKSFSFYTTPSPEMRGTVRRDPVVMKAVPYTVITKDDGQMVVTQPNAIVILECRGQQHRTALKFTQSVLGNVRSLAFTRDGHIITTEDHSVKKFTTSGEFVASVGGAEVGEFNLPMRVAVNPVTGEIFVVNNGGGPAFVKVLNRDLTVSRVIGEAELRYAHGIALDKHGTIYVANSGCGCISVYSPDGKLLRQFGSTGSNDGELYAPYAVAVDSIHNLVYVADGHNHRIAVFDTSGTFVAVFGGKEKEFGELNKPHSVALDVYGNIYVTNLNNQNIVVF